MTMPWQSDIKTTLRQLWRSQPEEAVYRTQLKFAGDPFPELVYSFHDASVELRCEFFQIDSVTPALPLSLSPVFETWQLHVQFRSRKSNGTDRAYSYLHDLRKQLVNRTICDNAGKIYRFQNDRTDAVFEEQEGNISFFVLPWRVEFRRYETLL